MSAADRVASRSTLTFGALIAASFAALLANFVTALPANLNGLFQVEFSPTGSQLAWISDASLLAIALPELTFGVLGDLYGRKRLLIIGSGLMAAGQTLSALAPNVYTLWAGQAFAGLGAAAFLAASLAVIAAGTTTVRDRGRGIALWAGALGLGAVVAPVLGGITGVQGSWRAAFVVGAILALVSGVLSLFLVQDSRAPEGRSLDWPGQATLAVALFAVLFGVIQGPTDGWTSGMILGAFAIGIIAFAMFVAVELRSPAPMLRLDLFRNRAFAIASLVTIVGMFSFLGTGYALSIRLGPVQQLSPLHASIAFVFLQGTPFVMFPLTGYLLSRVNPRWLLAGGFLVMAIGQYWMSTVPVTDSSMTSVAAPLILVGIGFGLTVSAIVAATVNTVPISLAGMASATTGLLRDFGFALGPAIIGSIALSRAGEELMRALATSDLPPDQLQPALGAASAGGALAVNGIPPGQPGSAAHDLAVNALGSSFSTGFLVCSIAAFVSAGLAALLMRGRRPEMVDEKEAVSGATPQPSPHPSAAPGSAV